MGSVTFFDGVHIFTPNGDVPDDSALRLVVLSPDYWYSRDEERQAVHAVLDYVQKNGTKPRYRGNRLVFLAPDHAVLSRLRDASRMALAWASIVDDIGEGRLNIDLLQKRQAEKELQSAEAVVPRTARECYKWLLCPVMHTPTESKPAIEAFPLTTTGSSTGSEFERICVENELVITTWSPIHLRDKLKEIYWKDGKIAAGALGFWEDTQRYLYLPRLRNRDVLAHAIYSGTASRDFFGTAYGQTGDTFEGFKLGDANVQLDDTLLLIELGAAERYEASIKKPDTGAGTGSVTTVGLHGTVTPTGGQISATSGTGTSGAVTTIPAKPKTFHGSVQINPSTAKMRLVQVAEEIIGILAGDPNASLDITVEINAEFPSGASDQIKRAVTENATSLGFKTKAWES